jgi:2-methylcitrate dehydratase PrpD
VRRGFAISGGRGGAVADLLTDEPGESTTARVHRPRVKDLCSARQVMTAISAVRTIVAANGLAPGDIDRIDVETPAAYVRMLDKPVVGNRRDSLSSAAYQLALAVLDPAGLHDVDRTTLRGGDALAALMASVRIHEGEDLTPRYPASWPARVWIYSGTRVFEAVADEVPGERDLSAAHLILKTAGLSAAAPGLPADAGSLVERSLRAAGPDDFDDITAFIDVAGPGRHATPPKQHTGEPAHEYAEPMKELLA